MIDGNQVPPSNRRPRNRKYATLHTIPMSTTPSRATLPKWKNNTVYRPPTQPESISPGHTPPESSINSEIQSNNHTPPVQNSDQSLFNIVNYQPESFNSKGT